MIFCWKNSLPLSVQYSDLLLYQWFPTLIYLQCVIGNHSCYFIHIFFRLWNVTKRFNLFDLLAVSWRFRRNFSGEKSWLSKFWIISISRFFAYFWLENDSICAMLDGFDPSSRIFLKKFEPISARIATMKKWKKFIMTICECLSRCKVAYKPLSSITL